MKRYGKDALQPRAQNPSDLVLNRLVVSEAKAMEVGKEVMDFFDIPAQKYGIRWLEYLEKYLEPLGPRIFDRVKETP